MSTLKKLIENLGDLILKPYIKIGILVFLISLMSFGIGYLFGRDLNPAPIVIEQSNG